MEKYLAKLLLAFGSVFLIYTVTFSQAALASKRSISEIKAAALESDNKCLSLLAALGKELPQGFEKGEYEIPPFCWSDAIKELKPVKVFDHRLNVAIVLNIQNGMEEGIYFFNVLSSWRPIGKNTDGFEFISKPEKPSLIYFRRNIRNDRKVN